MENITNITLENLNFSFIGRGSECFVNGQLKASCVINQYCPQIVGYTGKVALILAASYVLIDFVLPLVLSLMASKLNLGPSWAWIKDKGSRTALELWLREKLLWAFFIFCLYLIGIYVNFST